METRDGQPGPTQYSTDTPPQGDYLAPPTPTRQTTTAHSPRTPRRQLPATVPLRTAALIGLGTFALGLAVWPIADALPFSNSTMVIHGSMTLGPATYLPDGTGGCTAGDGYSDISAGTAVTIGDQSGATIAVGQLQTGRAKGDDASYTDGCVFAFDVRAPGGRTEYTVTVSHRGTQVFTAEQAAAGIALSLGG